MGILWYGLCSNKPLLLQDVGTDPIVGQWKIGRGSSGKAIAQMYHYFYRMLVLIPVVGQWKIGRGSSGKAFVQIIIYLYNNCFGVEMVAATFSFVEVVAASFSYV